MRDGIGRSRFCQPRNAVLSANRIAFDLACLN